MSITQPVVTKTQNGKIAVTAGNNPGFYQFTVTGSDALGVTQNQSGWILVGNPAATFTKAGDGQHGSPGGQLNLSVTVNPGQSAGTAPGTPVLFTTSAGSLSSRLVTADSNGNAAVVLTLPGSPGTVHVEAEGPFAVGHPTGIFTETAQ